MVSDEYLEGQQAALEGAMALDCPYPVGSIEAMDWYDGWASKAQDGEYI